MISVNFNFVIQFVSFIILVFVLKHLLFQPMLSIFQQREAKTEQPFETASQLSRQIEQQLIQYKEKITQAQAEAKEIKAQLKREGVAVERELIDTARKESFQALEAARQTIAKESSQIKAKLEKEVDNLSMAVFDKIANG